MSLKVLCAGCAPEERERAESDVRRALGARADGGVWTVSLVKVQRQWSVTLAHPPAATITCIAPEGRLAEAILGALGGGPAAADLPPPAGSTRSGAHPPAAAAARAPAAAPAVAPGLRADHHTCTSCQQSFVVRYEAGRDESEEMVAVACPHCWKRNHVLVAEGAAETKDFTAEKT